MGNLNIEITHYLVYNIYILNKRNDKLEKNTKHHCHSSV